MARYHQKRKKKKTRANNSPRRNWNHKKSRVGRRKISDPFELIKYTSNSNQISKSVSKTCYSVWVCLMLYTHTPSTHTSNLENVRDAFLMKKKPPANLVRVVFSCWENGKDENLSRRRRRRSISLLRFADTNPQSIWNKKKNVHISHRHKSVDKNSEA